MEAIVNMSEKRQEELSAVSKNLREKLEGAPNKSISAGKWFNDYHTRSGYAHYTFSGIVSQGLIDALGRRPNTDEIIIIVDNGFSHFGASCSYDSKTNKFSGRVSTD